MFPSREPKTPLKRPLLALTALVLALAPVVLILFASKALPATPPAPAGAPAAAATTPGLARWRVRNAAALNGGMSLVRTWTVRYRAHDGSRRIALVVLPRWYGPRNHPPIPLVISPHGRGAEPGANARLWGNLPALGRFAVVNPEGQGNRLEAASWGSPAQISDLARMPAIVRSALPWLSLAPRRVYAVGASMGAQETLLLAAQHPHLLAGAVAFDAPTNMAARYTAFAGLGGGLQHLARLEFGSIPRARGDVWADRSPLFYARELAASHVPLQIWWSTRDRVVVNQAGESGLLYRAIKRLNPSAPVVRFVGAWRHTAEVRPAGMLPVALARLGLLPIGAPA